MTRKDMVGEFSLLNTLIIIGFYLGIGKISQTM